MSERGTRQVCHRASPCPSQPTLSDGTSRCGRACRHVINNNGYIRAVVQHPYGESDQTEIRASQSSGVVRAQFLCVQAASVQR